MHEDQPRCWRWWGALGLLVITTLAYAPALRGEFVWDDYLNIVNDTRLRTLDGLARAWLRPTENYQTPYYPLTTTGFWLQYQLWGLRPVGYHLVNLLLHVVTSLLLWRVLVRLRVPGAFVAAALFAVHPVNVQSVAWMTELKNVLSASLCLAAVNAYLSFERIGSPVPLALASTAPSDAAPARCWRAYALALLCFTLAMLAKTASFPTPVALLLLLWWRLPGLCWRQLWPLLPLLVISVGLSLLNIHFDRLYDRSPVTPWTIGSWAGRLVITGRAICFYVGKLLWPADLTAIYPRWELDAGDPQQWLYLLAVGLVLLAAVVWGWRRQRRGVPAALLIYVICLAPLTLFESAYLRLSFVVDHWTYWANMALLPLLTALAALALRRRRALGLALAALVVLALLPVTFGRAATFQNALTLWSDNLRVNPDSWSAHNSLGAYWFDQGNPALAIEHYQWALALNPINAVAHNNLAWALLQMGRPAEALGHCQAALQLNPQYPPAYLNLAAVLRQLQRPEQAQAALRRALELRSDFAPAHVALGNLLRDTGRLEPAVDAYRAALRHEPRSVEALGNLGQTYAMLGDAANAVASLQRALQLDPDNWNLQISLARALNQQGQLPAALRHAQAAAQLKPQDSSVHNTLGIIHARLGQADLAQAAFARALALNPDNADAAANLARLRETVGP